jgi:hypothetical protein
MPTVNLGRALVIGAPGANFILGRRMIGHHLAANIPFDTLVRYRQLSVLSDSLVTFGNALKRNERRIVTPRHELR